MHATAKFRWPGIPPLVVKLGAISEDVTMAIYRLLKNSTFPPELAEEMTQAYETACVQLGLTERRSDPLTEIVARTIVEMAQTGAQDRHELCRLALSKIKDLKTDA